jgi:hypothetical protein
MHWATAKNMHMQVLDDLIGVLPGVDDETVACFGNALIGGYFFGCQQEVPKQGFILGGNIIGGSDMFIGNYQDVDGGGRINIVEGGYKIIFMNDLPGNLTGNNFTKNAIGHIIILLRRRNNTS